MPNDLFDTFMLNKSFQNISAKECQVLWKEILANSKLKWISAKKVAVTEDYGTAIALMIISTEELVKAFILALDGSGFKFRQTKGVERFFRDHEIRYSVAFFMFVLSFAGNELKDIFIKVQDGSIDIFKVNDELQHDSNLFLAQRKWWFLRKYIELKENLDWFANIDKLRQDGLYCDYKGAFKKPSDLTIDDFWDAYTKLKGVRSAGKTIIDTFTELDNGPFNVIASKYKNELIANFNKNNFYKDISSLLEDIRQDRPLEILKMKLESMQIGKRIFH